MWTISTSPVEGGLISGWTLTARVRDRARLAELQERLFGVFRLPPSDPPDPPRPFRLHRLEYAGHEIYFTDPLATRFPCSPAWCLTKDRLVLGLFPAAVQGYLARGADFRSLAETDAVKSVLKAEQPPSAVAYGDIRQLFQILYPVVQLRAQRVMGQWQTTSGSDPLLLPPPSLVDRHLLPEVASLRRVDGGIELSSHGTLPSSLGATAPAAIAITLPDALAARPGRQLAQSLENLRKIGLAMQHYHDTFKAFPAAYSVGADGKPMLSWRVHLLRYLDEDALLRQFNLREPWDSDHNQRLIAQMPRVFCAPGSRAERGKTVYLGVRGKDGIFGEPKPNTLLGNPPWGRSLLDIADGAARTIAVVEANDAHAVIWTRPDDYDPGVEDPIRALVGLRPEGFLAVFCDGHPRFIEQNLDPAGLRALFTIKGGEPHPLP